MYGISGGCTTLFHLAVRYPLVVFALSIVGFASNIPANPGVGDRLGTSSVVAHTQEDLVRENPTLVAEVDELRRTFDQKSIPAEDDVRRLLRSTDTCTDVSVADVLSDAEKRREAAWLIYLDKRSRGKPRTAATLFRSPPK